MTSISLHAVFYKKEDPGGTKPGRIFLLAFCLGLAVWLPWFLCFYPGVLTPDSVWQTGQAMRVYTYQDQHPFLHTLMIQLFWQLGSRVFAGAGFSVSAQQMTNAQINAGVGTYIAAQQILLAACFAYILMLCAKHGVRRAWRVFLWLFFFAVPYNALYSVTVVKNVPFTAAVLTFAAFLYEHTESGQRWTARGRAVLAALGFLFCLLASNGFPAFVFFAVCFAIAKPREFRKLALTFALTAALALVFKGPVERACGVEKADVSEALSVPLQQVAAVIFLDGKISEEQLAEVNEIFDTAVVKDAEHGYRPELADPIKDAVKAKGNSAQLTAHPLRYLGLWWEIGTANPGIYAKAWLGQTEGYLWPHIGAKQDYSTEVMQNSLGITRNNLWSNKAIIVLYNFLTNFTKVYVHLWSTGSSVWAVLAGVVIAAARKRPRYVFAPFLGVWLTVLASAPVSSDLRYIYCMFLGFLPLLFEACGGSENSESQQRC
ncbi:MAG: DUF6020 family protein [Lachnospiraceae bacterium]|nr:DUF6020 family protein [Lachnospiraceae bacterium]